MPCGCQGSTVRTAATQNVTTSPKQNVQPAERRAFGTDPSDFWAGPDRANQPALPKQ